MLFERFISKERNEPPDIDVDFEHERREEVIQYIYRKYGRERAALAATVICYRAQERGARRRQGARPARRTRSTQLSRSLRLVERRCADLDERLRERGFDPDSPVLRRVLMVTARAARRAAAPVAARRRFRHLRSSRCITLVPVENAAMPERTIIQWDKDDLETLGLLKVDCLALGMLTCVRKMPGRCCARIAASDLTPATIPGRRRRHLRDDPARRHRRRVPDRIARADGDAAAAEAGQFLRPGDRSGDRAARADPGRAWCIPTCAGGRGWSRSTIRRKNSRTVFERTLGMPLFQEQVMQLAIVAAGFTPGEADQLRRSMAAWKRHGGMEPHPRARGHRHGRARLHDRIRRADLRADQGLRQLRIPGIARGQFRADHLRQLLAEMPRTGGVHLRAAQFAADGFLLSRPQLVQDARRHGIDVRPVDVRYSDWDCTLEPWPDDAAATTGAAPGPAPGRRPARRRRRAHRRRARAGARFAMSTTSSRAPDWIARTRPCSPKPARCSGLAGHRHRARWAVAASEKQLPLFGAHSRCATTPDRHCRCRARSRTCCADYASIGLTLGRIRCRCCAGNCSAPLPPLARTARNGPRHAGAHGRPGHAAPAPGNRQRRHLRHAGGRGRHGQCRGLARCRPNASGACCSNRDCWRWKAGWNRPMACST